MSKIDELKQLSQSEPNATLRATYALQYAAEMEKGLGLDTTVVTNVATGEVRRSTFPARQALIEIVALTKGDLRAWAYEPTYGGRVQESATKLSLDGWCVEKVGFHADDEPNYLYTEHSGTRQDEMAPKVDAMRDRVQALLDQVRNKVPEGLVSNIELALERNWGTKLIESLKAVFSRRSDKLTEQERQEASAIIEEMEGADMQYAARPVMRKDDSSAEAGDDDTDYENRMGGYQLGVFHIFTSLNGPWQLGTGKGKLFLVNVDTGMSHAAYNTRGATMDEAKRRNAALRASKPAAPDASKSARATLTKLQRERGKELLRKKFGDSPLVEAVYDATMDGADKELGDANTFGHYDFIVGPVDGFEEESTGKWFILEENDQGFLDMEEFDSEAEAEAKWAELEAEWEKFESEGEDGDDSEKAARAGMRKVTHKPMNFNNGFPAGFKAVFMDDKKVAAQYGYTTDSQNGEDGEWTRDFTMPDKEVATGVIEFKGDQLEGTYDYTARISTPAQWRSRDINLGRYSNLKSAIKDVDDKLDAMEESLYDQGVGNDDEGEGDDIENSAKAPLRKKTLYTQDLDGAVSAAIDRGLVEDELGDGDDTDRNVLVSGKAIQKLPKVSKDVKDDAFSLWFIYKETTVGMVSVETYASRASALNDWNKLKQQYAEQEEKAAGATVRKGANARISTDQSGKKYVVVENSSGFTDHPIMHPDGTVAYDYPENFPQGVKDKAARLLAQLQQENDKETDAAPDDEKAAALKVGNIRPGWFTSEASFEKEFGFKPSQYPGLFRVTRNGVFGTGRLLDILRRNGGDTRQVSPR